ncbi:hypothetical protein FIV42_09945 [Persicimonas caeni]|uniref:Uncharacterized protein n=1 Tax=Persicimonas caeni TaxID=2292766 RepID=A0A4Y6PRT4_PERCE|nr:hypothetical protein [Persicimonas caeni]QDG51042.1 hypothetical protein FIV42_09945 [Persicimonas caeni]QED32263.1 hypothetical protein FRD00_09940 [Persicimonas caeni]
MNSTADDSEQGTPMDLGDEYIAQKTNVVMPWTHQIANDVVDQIQVEPNRLVFPVSGAPAEAASEFDRGDVLVSANPDRPFLRKVESVERTDSALIFNTRNAQLTEAVYKGELTPQQPTETDTSGVRRQELGAQEAPRISSGTVSIGVPDSKTQSIPNLQVSGGTITYTANNGVSFSAKPQIQLDASVYMDLKIEPGSNMDTSYTTFTGTKTCYSTNDCFPEAARGENRGVSCQANRCVYESTEYDGFWFDAAGPSCNDIIASLDYAAQNSSCDADFNAYYEGTKTLTQVKAGPCGDYLPPHPVQVDWAKDNCTGALKRMVFDAEGSLTPTTGPLKVGFSASAKKSWTIWETHDKRLMSKLFFIGWFPVYITANAKATLTASAEASAEATIELNPVEVTGLRYGNGFHYFADSGEDEGYGVRMNDGSIEPFYKGIDGSFEGNPERRPNPGFQGLNLEEQDLTVNLTGKASAKLQFSPRIDLLLYDVAGPYLEPFSPYASVQFDAGGVFSVRDGSSPSSACGENPASLCGRIGIESKIGLTAANICGSKCEWNKPINDTCSDYCPANDEMPLCVKTCLGDEAPKPLEVELSWESDAVDLDLAMLQPEYIDYQDDSFTNGSSYRHEGDECPASFGGSCYGIKDSNGKYTESIVMEQTGAAPPSGTQMTFEVENFQSTGQGTFDLIVKQDGQTVKEWKGQSTGQDGDKHELSFTLP